MNAYSPSQRLAMHVFDVLLPVATVIQVADTATAAMAPTLFEALVPLFMINGLVWMVAVIVHVVHAPGRCGTCQSRFPADYGAENAERHRSQLRRFHWWVERALRVAIVLGRPFGWIAERCGSGAATSAPITFIGGVLVAMAVWGAASTALGWLLGVAMWVVTAATFVLFWLLLRQARTHHALRPWCPWCRRRDDGDEEREPEPDPAPGKTVTG